MHRNVISFALFAALLPLHLTSAEEVGFWEDFALAGDRAEVLKQLIPGTEDYYYFHCLHHQNLAQFDEVDRLLKIWIERYKRTPRAREIIARQSLLTYGRSPQKTLAYVRSELDLRFDHKRVAAGQKPNLPTELAANLISKPTLLARAM